MKLTRVLVVEDDISLQGEPLAALLREAGYDVVGIAGCVTTAADLAMRYQPDVVLIDMHIPTTPDGPAAIEGGLVAAGDIRRVSPHSDFIWMTGHDLPDTLLRRVQRMDPTARFLKKPCAREQTLHDVRMTVARRAGCQMVFLSYAREDARIERELERYLQTLEDVEIDVWTDSQIQPSHLWRVEIDSALERADAAIVLISVDFIRSDFIRKVELFTLLAAHAKRNLPIYAVCAGPVPESTSLTSLSHLQFVLDPSKPVSKLTKHERAEKVWVPLCNLLTLNRVK